MVDQEWPPTDTLIGCRSVTRGNENETQFPGRDIRRWRWFWCRIIGQCAAHLPTYSTQWSSSGSVSTRISHFRWSDAITTSIRVTGGSMGTDLCRNGTWFKWEISVSNFQVVSGSSSAPSRHFEGTRDGEFVTVSLFHLIGLSSSSSFSLSSTQRVSLCPTGECQQMDMCFVSNWDELGIRVFN